MCLRSKVSSTWALTDHTWRVKLSELEVQGELIRALATNTDESRPTQANYLPTQSDFCFSMSTRHLYMLKYDLPSDIWIILSAHSRQFPPLTWPHNELDLTSPQPQKLWRDLSSGAPVSDSQCWFQSRELLGPGCHSLSQWILSVFGHTSRKSPRLLRIYSPVRLYSLFKISFIISYITNLND